MRTRIQVAELLRSGIGNKPGIGELFRGMVGRFRLLGVFVWGVSARVSRNLLTQSNHRGCCVPFYSPIRETDNPASTRTTGKPLKIRVSRRYPCLTCPTMSRKLDASKPLTTANNIMSTYIMSTKVESSTLKVEHQRDFGCCCVCFVFCFVCVVLVVVFVVCCVLCLFVLCVRYFCVCSVVVFCVKLTVTATRKVYFSQESKRFADYERHRCRRAHTRFAYRAFPLRRCCCRPHPHRNGNSYPITTTRTTTSTEGPGR